MLDGKSIVLASGLNVEDCVNHLFNISEMARNNNIKFFYLTYPTTSFQANASGWVNPSTIDFGSHCNVGDDGVARIVTLDGQNALKLSPNYTFFIITTFNLTFLDANTKTIIRLGLDYWENGVKSSIAYDVHELVCEGTILGTSRAYAEHKIDLRLITPSDNIDGYLLSFYATTDVKPDALQNIRQYVFAINSRMK